jgi:hypothetical protein
LLSFSATCTFALIILPIFAKVVDLWCLIRLWFFST